MEADQFVSNVVEVSAPAWMTVLKMDIYFHKLSDEKAWKVLVQSIYKFEIGNTINGVCRYSCITSFLTNSVSFLKSLPTTSRPEEVASWIKRKKKDLPFDIDPEEYGSSFMAWWIAIQPEWRVKDDGSFNYEVPKDETGVYSIRVGRLASLWSLSLFLGG